jgi:mannose-6-phosphate isomerase
MEAMLLRPAYKDYLWGGTRLKSEYGKKTDITPLAESWECSVHPDGPSVVASGQFKGQTLAEVLDAHPEFIGSKAKDTGFPVLVKFIDAAQNLSVQVHPDDDYAVRSENQRGKTEMWYVLDANPGAELVCGFKHDVTPELLKKAASEGSLAKHLLHLKVQKGDVFHIPAGTVHAIGAGVLLVEIQENSNVTYRIYDYDRTDKDGNKRELHIDKAIEIMDMKARKDVRQKPRFVRFLPGASREILSRCRYFDTERIMVSMGFTFVVMDTSFQVLLCTEGNGGITGGDMTRDLRFKRGDCIFIPAGIGRCSVMGQAELIKVRC